MKRMIVDKNMLEDPNKLGDRHPLRAWLDKPQTAAIKFFCERLEQAKNGEAAARKQLAAKCEAAAADLALMAKGQETYAANLAEHARKYTEAELGILRKGEPVPEELLAKITGEILGLADTLFMAHPYFKVRPPLRKLSNAFMFCYAIAGYVVALRCLKEGGPGGRERAKGTFADEAPHAVVRLSSFNLRRVRVTLQAREVESIQLLWCETRKQRVGLVSRLSMRRIIARRTKAATVLA